jgi:hypothetical protein
MIPQTLVGCWFAKAILGIERPGHKYVRRVPKAGGRYDYVYKESSVRQTETPQFKAWFGNSKVVGNAGQPLVVYHGTAVDFNAFDPAKIGERTGRAKVDKVGFYFSDNPKVAESYVETDESGKEVFSKAPHEYVGGAHLIPVYLRLQNPIQYDAKEKSFMSVLGPALALAKKRGADGVIIRNLFDNANLRANFDLRTSTTYVVFSPTQIKSATGNSGAFDAANPDITKSVGAERPGHKYLTRSPLAGGGYSYVYREPVNEAPVHVEPLELATAMAARMNKDKAKNAAEQIKKYGEAQRYNLVPDTPEMHMTYATKFDTWMRTKDVGQLRSLLVQRGNEESWRYFKRFTGAEGSTIPEREAAVRAWVGDAVYDASVVREKEFRKEQDQKRAAEMEVKAQENFLKEKETIGKHPYYDLDGKTVITFGEWMTKRHADGYTMLLKLPVPGKGGGPSSKLGYFLENVTTKSGFQLSGEYRRYAEWWLVAKAAEK